MKSSFATEIDRLETAMGAAAMRDSRADGPLVGVPDPPAILVVDGVLTDPMAYRALALAQPFGDITIGAVTFHGIAPVPDATFSDWLKATIGSPVGVTFLRQSPAGQVEPNYIHTDRDMGEWTGILYLTPDPPEGDGTTFWRHRRTGSYQSASEQPEEFTAEWLAWRDDGQWEPWRTVEARFNRAIVFPAAAYHSRAIRENYGVGLSSRLTQVAFSRRTICQ